MTSLGITLRIISLSRGKLEGHLEVSGETFSGDDFREEVPFEIDNSHEWDIPVGGTGCDVHIKVWLDGPSRVCAVGHLQCGPFRHPMDAPVCANV